MLRGCEVQEPGRDEPVVDRHHAPAHPRAAVDKIPILSMAYGLSASADGQTFPWVFNPPATYWDGLSQVISYIGKQEGGLDKLKGKKIGYIFLDAGYGREPIPLLEQLAKDYGFEVKFYPIAAQDMQNQSSQWLNVRRDKPDYMVLWGWGAMNGAAVKEAARTGYPMDKFYSVWWPGDDDLRATGEPAKGFKSLNWHSADGNYAALADIKKHVVDKKLSQANPEKVGEVLYNRGVYNSMLIAEGIRNAQKVTGKKVVTGEDVRRGLESMNIDAARLKEMGMEGFAQPIKLTCADHNGHLVDLHAAMGRQEVREDLRTDPPDDRQGAAAARQRREGLRGKERRMAQAQRSLRQGFVTGQRSRGGIFAARAFTFDTCGAEMSQTMPTPASAASPEAVLVVNNIEVIYDHVILVLKGVSLAFPRAASWRSWAPTARARPPR